MNLLQKIKHALSRKRTKDDIFKPKNAKLDCRSEHLSESGRYRLVVTPFTTGKGTWNYSQGLVYRVGEELPIAEVRRNYGHFPFLFVEDHPNGHQYLVCGEDYQGQTVIELDTGKRRDTLPEEARQGWGFCWAEYKFHPATQTIVVDGCFWGGGYEYKFYDFSDPMAGWPLVEIDFCVDADERPPTFEEDGTIKCYQTKDPHEDDEDYEGDTPVEDRVLASIVTLRREGSKLVKADEWVSEAEQQYRAEQEAFRVKHEQQWKEYRATDSLYTLSMELRSNPAFDEKCSEGVGVTFSGWGEDYWDGRESRVCLDLIRHHKRKPTIELEWATKTGPIKLIVWQKKLFQKQPVKIVRWFEHSEQGMRDAFAASVEAARG